MLKTPIKGIAIILIALIWPYVAYAQDIEQVAKAPLLIGNGGLSFSQIGQYSPDSLARITPYSYYLSGNLNFRLLGVVDVPMSMAYTNNQTTANLTIPFNRFSLSPSYKWIRTHMGYSAMSFSPYTLSGHEFFGGGVELTPGDKFEVAAMYGRLRKAVEADSSGMNASYRRVGGAFKIGYRAKKLEVSVNMLKAQDDGQSIQFNERDSNYIAPQENIAGSVALNWHLKHNISVQGEYGLSAVNRDIRSSDSLNNAFADKLFRRQGDVAVYHAFKTSVRQSSTLGQIGATYERIAPNYNTFGAYYYTNDFENITINMASSLIRWLHWSLDAGYQRDNLENQKVNTSKRAIYSANATSAITRKLSLGLNYSNVQSFVHIRDIYNDINQTNEFENLDTLNFTQLNMSASANLNYALRSSKTQRQNFNLGFTYQEASEQQSDDQKYLGNRITNTMLAYQFSLIPTRLNIATGINHNQNKTRETNMQVLSYNLSVQKTLWENFKTALITTYSNSFNEGGNLANVVNVRLTSGYRLKKRHNFNLSLAMLDNKSVNRHIRQYSANLNYNYIFNFNVERKDKKTRFKGYF